MKEDILSTYDNASLNYGYNSNSLHKLGFDARKLESAAINQILNVLGLSNYDVIFTSGNAESFTMIINNIKGNIASDNEEFIKLCEEMNKEVVSVDRIDKSTFISVKNEDYYDKRINHIDIDLKKSYKDLNRYDFITIEDDIPFFGVLLKKKNIDITNLIHGGKSTTKYRSGTAAVPLIASFSKLVKLKYKK